MALLSRLVIREVSRAWLQAHWLPRPRPFLPQSWVSGTLFLLGFHPAAHTGGLSSAYRSVCEALCLSGSCRSQSSEFLQHPVCAPDLGVPGGGGLGRELTGLVLAAAFPGRPLGVGQRGCGWPWPPWLTVTVPAPPEPAGASRGLPGGNHRPGGPQRFSPTGWSRQGAPGPVQFRGGDSGPQGEWLVQLFSARLLVLSPVSARPDTSALRCALGRSRPTPPVAAAGLLAARPERGRLSQRVTQSLCFHI